MSDPRYPQLFQVNDQQWFALDAIETIDDYGDDIGVTLKSGRKHRLSSAVRDRFFAIISKMVEVPHG